MMPVIARTLRGMARVWSGQAPAWRLSPDRAAAAAMVVCATALLAAGCSAGHGTVPAARGAAVPVSRSAAPLAAGAGMRLAAGV
jgi:hypothetical protein